MMMQFTYDNGKTYTGTIETQAKPQADRILVKLADKLPNGKDDYRTLILAKIVSSTQLTVN